MRKVFWCSLAGGVMVMGGVFTSAFYAARHPESLTGRVVLGAGRIATAANPVTMLESAIVRLEKGAAQPAAEKAPGGGEELAEPVAEQGEVRGEIVIPENEPAQAVAEIEPALVQVGHDDAVECPAGGAAECPVRMPLCDEDTSEKLGMPCSEGDIEEQEESGVGSTGAAEKLFRLFEKAVKKSDEGDAEPAVQPKPECREAPYHHAHYSGCPYTGHGSMSCPAGHSMPVTQPAPLTQPGAEEASEPEHQSSALKSIRRFGTRGVEDAAPAAAELDTMEYRVGDGQLYDFGRGPM